MSELCRFRFSLALGVSSYLRQAALSLHRASALGSLVEYYRTQVRQPVHRVGEVLDTICSAPDASHTRLDRSSAIQRMSRPVWSLSKVFLSFWGRLVGGTVLVPLDELGFVRATLREFSDVVDAGWAISTDQKNELRMNLQCASDLLAGAVWRKDATARIERVEHLNHADHLRALVPVEQIAGEGWLELDGL